MDFEKFKTPKKLSDLSGVFFQVFVSYTVCMTDFQVKFCMSTFSAAILLETDH